MATTVEIVISGLDEVSPTFKTISDGANRMAADLKASLESAGRQMRDVGGAMTTLTAPLGLAGGFAMKFSNELNSAMGDVATMIPGRTQEIGDFKKEVQQLAIDVGKGTTDIAGGLYQVLSAFGDGPDSMATLTVAAQAATAGVAGTTDAINLLSAVTKGYGDTSLAAVKNTSDMAFTTVRLGQTTFPELAGSIGTVVPLAAELGVTTTELFGTFATLTGVTGNAAAVSTQFRGILQALMAPTDSMAMLIAELGFESGKAMVGQLGLEQTTALIAQRAKETGAPLQQFIGSIEGQTAALALTGAQADVFSEKLAAMGQVAGATDEAFAAKTQGVNAAGFALDQFQQRMAVTAQNLGDQLAPAFMAALDAAQPLFDLIQRGVDWFSGLEAETQKTIVTIGAIAVVAGPLLIVLGTIVSSIGALIPLFTALSPVIITVTKSQAGLNLAMSANPVGLVIAAIAALIAIGILLWRNWDEITAFLSESWQSIKAAAVSVWDAIAEFFVGLWDGITTLVTATWDTITTFLSATWQSITGGISAAWTAIADWFAQWWGTILLGIVTGGIGLLVMLIVANWDLIKETTLRIWNSILEFFINLWPNLTELAIAGLTALAEWFSRKLTEIQLGWIAGWDAIMDFVRNFWPHLMNMATAGMTALVDWIMDKAASFKQGFIGTWQGILDFLSNLPARMVTAGANIIKGLVKGIASINIPVPDVSIGFTTGPFGLQVPKLNIGVNWRSLGSMIPWLAEGGIATGPVIAGLGEAGDEAILPIDRIVPLMATALDQAGGSAPPTIVNIDMRGSTFRDGRDAVGQIHRGMERRGVRLTEG